MDGVAIKQMSSGKKTDRCKSIKEEVACDLRSGSWEACLSEGGKELPVAGIELVTWRTNDMELTSLPITNITTAPTAALTKCSTQATFLSLFLFFKNKKKAFFSQGNKRKMSSPNVYHCGRHIN